ncbi:MAG: Fe-S biogenesis protein NfuA [Wenzhouxiangella sp.]|nr:MAG: Fe-S biogenesis protein NfuA [Wenzhouxiangella sp.]
MVTITPAARDYFSSLLEQQPEGTNLRIRIDRPGSPNAEVELAYCPDGGEQATDTAMDCQAFKLFIESESLPVLSEAMIDFESNPMGGELSIRAPGLKGERPADGAPLSERVDWVLEARINPMVASHGGQVSLVQITDENDVVLKFGGGCQGCGMVDVTLKQGIETTMKQEIPEIRNVVDSTDHSSGTNPYY